MSWHTNEDKVREFFGDIATIRAVRIASDHETGKPKGFCHVEFETNEGASKAVRELNGEMLDGRACRLDISAN